MKKSEAIIRRNKTCLSLQKDYCNIKQWGSSYIGKQIWKPTVC